MLGITHSSRVMSLKVLCSANARSSTHHSALKLVVGRQYSPRSPNQQLYVDLLENNKTQIVVAIGAAGSGKTKLAVEVGLSKLLSGQVEKIVLTRPAISVEGEHHGYLPGTLDEKMDPWMAPIYDAIDKKRVEKMLNDGVLQIAPLGFMRGRTFTNSWIICDEAQNCSSNQLLMAMTRMGENSKMVIAGDIDQHDRKNEESGLAGLVQLVNANNGNCVSTANPIEVVKFTSDDVQRSEIVKHVLRLYNLYQ